MALSQHIINLTRLALADRVLTYKERETIVDAAIKEGVKSDEINQYLDNALNERLKYYTKEELKCCPACGAQIPLISDMCPYCGNYLQNIDTQRVGPPIFVIGDDADIIRSENMRVWQEKKNLKTCPDCGAPFPLLSNICLSCGHIMHEQRGTELNIKTLIVKIEKSIRRLKNVPIPSIIDFIMYYGSILLFLTFFFCSIFNPDTIVFFLCFTFVAFFFLVARNKEALTIQEADEYYYEALYTHKMYLRIVKTLYGNNKEALDLLDSYSSKIKAIKKRRILNMIFLSIDVIVFLGFILFFKHFFLPLIH